MTEQRAPAAAGILKIAHVTGYYMPGLGYQENYLPFAQAALGHRVHIVTSDRPVPDARFGSVTPPKAEIGVSMDGPVALHRLPVRFELRRRNNLVLRGLLRTLRDLDADIVHLHGVTPLTTLSVLASPPRGAAIIVDHHLCRFNFAPWTFVKRVYYAFFRHVVMPVLARRVAAWLPINDDARETLNDRLGIGGPRVRINRLGADLDRFGFDESLRARARQELGWTDGQRVFIHAGRLGPNKELEVLFKALDGRAPGDVLIVVGAADPQYDAQLRAHAAAVRADIRFLPMQPQMDLVRLFNAADFAVWPGDGSITLIQAMACGLLPIIADNPGPDYVADAPDALTFRRGDAGALARCLDAARDTSTERRKRIAAFCRGHFDWAGIATESIEIYRDAIAARPDRMQ